MIVKVKEPQPAEWRAAARGPDPLHLSAPRADPEQTKGLLASGCTAIAYETVTDAHGGLPLLAPMSEVAGRLSIQAAGAALAEAQWRPRHAARRRAGRAAGARSSVIGGGVVGMHAARMAVGLGADVVILDRSLPRLRQLDEISRPRAHALLDPASDRGGGRRRRPRHRRGAGPRRRARRSWSPARCWQA